MSRAALSATRTTIYRWIFLQCLMVLGAALLVFGWQGKAVAVTFLLGAVICMVPNSLFALWWFASYRVQKLKRQVMVFYIWEWIKLFLVGILFVMVQRWLTMDIFIALLGFVSAQVAFWLAPLIN